MIFLNLLCDSRDRTTGLPNTKTQRCVRMLSIPFVG